jgi:acyl carrier protein
MRPSNQEDAQDIPAKRRQDCVQQIIMALEPFRKDASPISEQTDLVRDLNLDSLAVMDLLMDLEDRFEVSIPLNLMPEIRTVGDLADAVTSIREGT